MVGKRVKDVFKGNDTLPIKVTLGRWMPSGSIHSRILHESRHLPKAVQEKGTFVPLALAPLLLLVRRGLRQHCLHLLIAYVLLVLPRHLGGFHDVSANL